MSDLIDRQAAIDALKICDANYDGTNCDKCPLRDERWNGAWYDNEIDCYTKLMRDSAKLLELPRKGKWIYGESEIGNDGYYCSVCGNFVPWKYDEYDIDFIKEFLFCPKCGADMRGDSDD